jgi:hypothetical protein
MQCPYLVSVMAIFYIHVIQYTRKHIIAAADSPTPSPVAIAPSIVHRTYSTSSLTNHHRRLQMRHTLRKLAAGFVALMFIVALMNVSAQAADKKKVKGSGKSARLISQTVTYPGDHPKHEFTELVRMDTFTSSDPDFNNTDVLFYVHLDLVEGSGPHNGYATVSTKSGDAIHFKFAGSGKLVAKEGGAWEQPFDGKFEWTGGSGKFKNIKGTGTYKGVLKPDAVAYDWEADVEY